MVYVTLLTGNREPHKSSVPSAGPRTPYLHRACVAGCLICYPHTKKSPGKIQETLSTFKNLPEQLNHKNFCLQKPSLNRHLHYQRTGDKTIAENSNVHLEYATHFTGIKSLTKQAVTLRVPEHRTYTQDMRSRLPDVPPAQTSTH